MDVVFKTLKVGELGRIESPWNSLRLLHLAQSSHFRKYFARQTFEERCKKFRALPEENTCISRPRKIKAALWWGIAYVLSGMRRANWIPFT